MIFFDVAFVHETAKAALVKYRGAELWLPKSQCECPWFGRGLEAGDEIEVGVPLWLAREKELVP